MDFLQSEIGVIIISLLVGALGVIASRATWKMANDPRVEEFKKAYPVFNLVMEIAAQSLKGTRAGLAFEAAYTIWQGQGLSPAEARKYAKVMLENFDLDKYVGTQFDNLADAQVAQGQAIAEQLIPGYSASQGLVLPQSRSEDL